jgi:hypothetical protein
MEQTKSYVKLYIIPADEYQSNTSLNHPVSVPPLILIPRFRLRKAYGATGSAIRKTYGATGSALRQATTRQAFGWPA